MQSHYLIISPTKHDDKVLKIMKMLKEGQVETIFQKIFKLNQSTVALI